MSTPTAHYSQKQPKESVISSLPPVRSPIRGKPTVSDRHHPALDFIPAEATNVISPTGTTYQGMRHTTSVCGVSILRAGASLENAMRRGYTYDHLNMFWIPLIVSESGPLSFGKILIQRDEETCLPTLFYSKFPPNITSQSRSSVNYTWISRLADDDILQRL